MPYSSFIYMKADNNVIPLRLPPEQRKKLILDAALKLLAKDGPVHFSMRNVAEKVGIKLASLQYHYPSRGKLLVAMLDESLVRTHQRMSELVNSQNPGTSLEQRFRNLLQEHINWGKDPSNRGLAIAFNILSDREPDLLKGIAEAVKSTIVQIAILVSDLNTGITENEAQNRAAIIMSMLEGFWQVTNEGMPMHHRRKILETKLIDQAISIVLEP